MYFGRKQDLKKFKYLFWICHPCHEILDMSRHNNTHMHFSHKSMFYFANAIFSLVCPYILYYNKRVNNPSSHLSFQPCAQHTALPPFDHIPEANYSAPNKDTQYWGTVLPFNLWSVSLFSLLKCWVFFLQTHSKDQSDLGYMLLKRGKSSKVEGNVEVGGHQ